MKRANAFARDARSTVRSSVESLANAAASFVRTTVPTVRAKLEEVIEALQEEPAPTPDAPRQETRDDILQAIAAGRLNVEDGLARIRALETRKEN